MIPYKSIYKENEEEIQMYIDILNDMDESNPRYEKYKDILKTKYNMDYKKIDYSYYINNPNLKDLKTKNDFPNFKLYVDYCKAIWRERKLIDFEHNRNYNNLDIVNIEGLCKQLNIKFSITSESMQGHGSSDYIKLSKDGLNKYFVLHELGHVYDYRYNSSIENICKDMRFSPTIYGCNNSGETFAENFYFYFDNPSLLKNKLKQCYTQMNKLINTKWKSTIKKFIL
jgi:hypothetical protein